MKLIEVVVGTMFVWGGDAAVAPDGYAFGGTALPCSQYQKLCDALAPYYVRDGVVTLPDCPQQEPNKTCIIRIR